MLLIFGLATGFLALAMLVGQVQGKTPSALRGVFGWLLVLLLGGGAGGLVVAGIEQDAAAQQAAVAAARAAGSFENPEPAMADGGPSANGKKGGSKRGASKKGGGKRGSRKGGSKKGGGKKGGWGRRSRGPVVPLTAERAERIAALKKAGAMLQSRGGQVARLQFTGPEVTDKHMKLLAGLSGTRSLIISAENVTPEGLASLASMTGLVELTLRGTPKVNDLVLAHVRGMPKLTLLNLYGTAITDAGMPFLAGLKALRTLDLEKTALTDKGIASLSGLTSLTRVVLSRTAVGDDGIGALVGISGLQQLELFETRVTDAGVDHLLKFKQAKLFRVTKTDGLTDTGIRRIRLAMPDCVVRFSD